MSNNYLYQELPKDKKFLLKYFKGDLQNSYVRYVVFFGSHNNFMDHTGIKITESWLKKLESKYKDLIYLHSLSKSLSNFALLSELESGDLKLFDRKGCKYNIKKYLIMSNIYNYGMS